MRTILTIVVTFVLTTLFWFSVPTVRQIIENSFDNNYEDSHAVVMVEPSNKNDISNEGKGGTNNTTSAPVASPSEPKESLSIVGTWVYADPQTSEEKNYKLIFNAYGAFKYYNTSIGYTMREDDYSTNGNTLKIGYDRGKFALSRVNGVDYLEIFSITDYAGKLRRIK